MIKKTICVVLSVLVLLAGLPFAAHAAEIIDSGYLGLEGDGNSIIEWKLDNKGTLTISGNGELVPDRNANGIGYPFPWNGKKIKKVVIEEGVTSIASNEFSSFGSVTSVSLPESLRTIGDFAFSDCSALTSIVIPKNVTEIGSRAFLGCNNLKDITFPSHLSYIGTSAFSYTEWFRSQPDGMVYIGDILIGCKGDLPKNALVRIKNGTRMISGGVFSRRAELTSVMIPNGVTTIGAGAFSDCTGLKSVFIPDSVVMIENRAFSGCTGLKSLSGCTGVTKTGLDVFEDTGWWNDQPDGMVYIGSVAYMYKGAMLPHTSVDLKIDTKVIADGAFGRCGDRLAYIKIPDGVKTIGVGAFAGCTGLTSVTIPNSVTVIDSYAFANCTGLTYVKIPESVTTLGERVFEECTSLKQITLGNGITEIGSRAFASCTSLRSIDFPAGVRSIGAGALWNCTELKSYSLPAGNPNYEIRENCLIQKKNKMMLFGNRNGTIPDDAQFIAAFAFCRYTDLTSVAIPDSVKGIGWNAFGFCKGLKGILIPRGVTYIRSGAFSSESVIYGYAGSYVQRWAQENNYVFHLVEELTGDPDCDGAVTSADARLALRASVMLEQYPEGSAQFFAADVNKDGKLGSDDARTILRVSVKLESF